MYFSNVTHFLDEQGNIPKEMPQEARELASFLALVVDATTKTMPSILTTTDIRCFQKDCHGLIKTAIKHDNAEIHWSVLNAKMKAKLVNGRRRSGQYIISIE